MMVAKANTIKPTFTISSAVKPSTSRLKWSPGNENCATVDRRHYRCVEYSNGGRSSAGRSAHAAGAEPDARHSHLHRVPSAGLSLQHWRAHARGLEPDARRHEELWHERN